MLLVGDVVKPAVRPCSAEPPTLRRNGMSDELQEANRANWEARVPLHAASDMYDLDAYVADPRKLSDVVAFDAPFLGDLQGLRAVHLQCHLGTDTLSLARLGAEVTGVDFSPAGLKVAEDLARRAGTNVRYVEASVEQVPERLPETFDLVYTGVGALNWLPSITRWAEVVAGLLIPGGRLYVREQHPVLSSLDDEREDGQLVLRHPYFEDGGPVRWDDPTTYAGPGEVAAPVTYEWNHGLGETVQAVIDAGLTVTALREHREVEWQALPHMVPVGGGRYALPDHRDRAPLMFTLEAVRPDEPGPPRPRCSRPAPEDGAVDGSAAPG
jgi:SAM-dependent methyltransferase